MHALTIFIFYLFIFTLQFGKINNQQMSQLKFNQTFLCMSNNHQLPQTKVSFFTQPHDFSTLSLSHFYSLSHFEFRVSEKERKLIFFFYSFFSSLSILLCLHTCILILKFLFYLSTILFCSSMPLFSSSFDFGCLFSINISQFYVSFCLCR